MSLDGKLREILEPIINQAFYDGFEVGGEDYGDDGWVAALPEDVIAQIRAAFADEGYYTLRQLENVRYHLMTGQEWYDKFEKELYVLAQHGNFVFMDETIKEILEAAKIAAGLS